MSELYIVTGATGFIGNNIVRELISRGRSVRCFVRDAEKAARVLNGLDIDVMTGSLTEGGGFERAFADADSFVVIHAAGLVALGDKRKNAQLENDNVAATRYVTDTAKSMGARKLIYISSVHALKAPEKGATLREPENFSSSGLREGYARTKAAATKYVLEREGGGFETVSLHPSGVCGPNDPGDTYLTKLILQYAAGKIPAGVKGGYDFVDVRDVAFAAAEAAEAGRRGCYLLAGNYVTVKEMLKLLSEHTGRKKKNFILPMWTAKAALPLLSLYSRIRRTEPLYTSYSLMTLSQNASFSTEKARNELGYSPRPFSHTIKDAVDHLRREGRLYSQLK